MNPSRTFHKRSFVGRKSRAIACIVGLVLGACRDSHSTAPEAESIQSTNSADTQSFPQLRGDSAAADSIGRALAIALNSGAIRQQVLEDLRDSPFPKHHIHLPSYLSGPRGASLLTALAEVAGIPPNRIVQMSLIRGGLSAWYGKVRRSDVLDRHSGYCRQGNPTDACGTPNRVSRRRNHANDLQDHWGVASTRAVNRGAIPISRAQSNRSLVRSKSGD